MAARTDLPPALAALVEVALGLLRRAPSARIAVARVGGLLDPELLPGELRERLEQEVALAREATCVPLRPKEVERVLRGAWGRPPGKVLDALEREPLAVTPAGQVHRAEHEGADVVVKVLRPGVESAVRADLVLLDALAGPLGAAFPRLDAAALLRDFREAALDELDLEHEASQQRRLARALRGIPGVRVPRPHLDLARDQVLVAEHLEGETLAAGARPPDPGAAAEALVAAFRAAVLDAALVPVDLRPSHVVVAPGGELGLLGLGTARPADRVRAEAMLAGARALRDGDAEAFATAAAGAGVMGADDARTAHGLLRDVLGELLGGSATLDAEALRRLAGRALSAAPDLVRLAGGAAPQATDVALGRGVGQLAAVLARLGATRDWVTLSAR
jgi:predicted unusual protein kinase regulating ubiquinone biosynthesis (AarF/ABC1/UbiB family)